MVNGAEPVPLGERSPLGLRDRHQWHRISAPLELGQIPTCQGSMQGMELLDDMVELELVQCNGIPEKPRLTQGPRHRGEQLGTGAGVATGEQHHVMPRCSNSSVRQCTTRSVPPYRRGGTLSQRGKISAIRIAKTPDHD